MMKELAHVIIVTDYAFVIGGASKVAIASAMALAERGYDTHHFSAVGPVDAGMERAGVHVQCLHEPASLYHPNKLIGAQKGLWNRTAAAAFDRLLSQFSPANTIVHVHQWTKALSPSIFDPMIKRGFGFVVTLHDYFISCPNGGFLEYNTAEICKREPLSVGCMICNCDPRNYAHKLWRVGRQLIQNHVLMASKRLSHVIYVSEFSRSILSRYLPQTLTWHFVPNPIQTVKIPRVDVTQNQAFVFVGRLSKEKGGDLFAKAAKLAQVPAIFVGDGEQRAQIQRVNGDARVTGWVNPEEVYQALKHARALVFPSIWYEMQGLTVAEAASMGVPSIVGDRTAARDFVVNGETGLYMNGASADDLALKLGMLRDDGLLSQMSVAAYERYWADPPTIERHASRLEETYHTVLAERNRAQAG